MADSHARPLGLYFEADGYVEHVPGAKVAPTQAMGLMGRQVAGKEFLDAYLTHGTFPALEAVCRTAELSEPLKEIIKAHPARRPWNLRVATESEFCRQPAAELLYFPCPPLTRLAWGRQAVGGGRFALCGVTHTTCTPGVMNGLCEMLTAPYESFDALICTSQSVLHTVRTVLDHHIAYLRDRFGGAPQFRPRLEVIPLGVNPEKFHPATDNERLPRDRCWALSPAKS